MAIDTIVAGAIGAIGAIAGIGCNSVGDEGERYLAKASGFSSWQ